MINLQRNQSEIFPINAAAHLDNMQTYRYMSNENPVTKESPSELIYGVSPDGRWCQVNATQDKDVYSDLKSKKKKNIFIRSQISQNQEQDTLTQDEQDDKIKKYCKFIFIIDCISSVVSIFIPFISFLEIYYHIYSQAEYSDQGLMIKKEFQSNDISIILRNVSIVLSMLLGILVLPRFKFNQAISLSSSEYETVQSFNKKQRKMRLILLIELIFNFLILPNKYDIPIEGRALGGSYKYSLNTIFTIINILKCYHIFKLAFHFASSFKFFSPNISFLFKATFHKRPFLYIFIFFFFTCFVSTLSLHIVEINYQKDHLNKQYDFNELYNTFWVVINTLLTVGFGDGYPYTHIGRGICIGLAILGTVFIGILVAAFNKISIPSKKEKLIQQQIHIEKFQKICARFLYHQYKYKKQNTIDNYINVQLSRQQYSIIRKDPFLQQHFDNVKQRNIQQKILQKYDQVKEMIQGLQQQLVQLQDIFLKQLISLKEELQLS